LLPDFFTLLRNPIQLLALGFGSGLAPKAPGTVGTLAAIPFYFLLAYCSLEWQLVIIVLAFMGGIYVCQYTADALGVHDHPGIVWDEFVGYWVTMLAVPLAGAEFSWQWIVAGFLFFRLFDIAKPWPINWVDNKVHGGFGIMLDDLLAGIIAALCLLVLIVFFA
jgi:phosphatidylglycerophosphatase A